MKVGKTSLGLPEQIGRGPWGLQFQSRCCQDTCKPESWLPVGVTYLRHPENDSQQKPWEAERTPPISSCRTSFLHFRTRSQCPCYQRKLTWTHWDSDSVAPGVSLRSRGQCSRDKEMLLTIDNPEKSVLEEELGSCPLSLTGCVPLSRSQLPPLESGVTILPA